MVVTIPKKKCVRSPKHVEKETRVHFELPVSNVDSFLNPSRAKACEGRENLKRMVFFLWCCWRRRNMGAGQRFGMRQMRSPSCRLSQSTLPRMYSILFNLSCWLVPWYGMENEKPEVERHFPPTVFGLLLDWCACTNIKHLDDGGARWDGRWGMVQLAPAWVRLFKERGWWGDRRMNEECKYTWCC